MTPRRCRSCSASGALDGEADDDPFLADKARGELKALERRLGRIGSSSWPQRTAVDVDGKPGRDPTYVKPGQHHVKLRSPAGETLERDLEVEAGALVELPMVARAAVPAVPGNKLEKPKSRGWIAAVVI